MRKQVAVKSKLFASEYASKLWNKLYDVRIPNHLTLNDNYIRQRGTLTSRDPRYASMMANDLTNVKITVMKMLEYFIQGITVYIPSREDMLTIHDDIESYLGEWRVQLEVAINIDVTNHKEMLNDLERLSKYIYAKAGMKELQKIDVTNYPTFGLRSPMAPIKEKEDLRTEKPEYEGISGLLRGRNGERLRRY